MFGFIIPLLLVLIYTYKQLPIYFFAAFKRKTARSHCPLEMLAQFLIQLSFNKLSGFIYTLISIRARCGNSWPIMEKSVPTMLMAKKNMSVSGGGKKQQHTTQEE